MQMTTTTRVRANGWDTHRWAADECDVACLRCDTPAHSTHASQVCPAVTEREELR